MKNYLLIPYFSKLIAELRFIFLLQKVNEQLMWIVQGKMPFLFNE